MDYGIRFLKRNGLGCTIERTPPVQSKTFLRLATKSIVTPTYRDMMREGVILPDANLVPGETVLVDSDRYIVQSVLGDKSGLHAWYGVKANVTLTLKRRMETVDQWGNLVITWTTLKTNIPAFGQTVQARLKDEDPGILPSTVAVFLVASNAGIQLMDRLIANNTAYQVDHVDAMFLPNLVRVQVSFDLRGDA